MRRHSWFPSACASLGFLLVTAPALAQSISVGNALRPNRDENGNPLNLQVNIVNRSECLADDFIRYPITLSGGSGLDLEVWAGSNCESLENRDGNLDGCWLVYEDASPSTDNIDVRVQDIIAGKVDRASYSALGSGTDEACDKGNGSPETANLHFFLINGSDEVAATGTSTSGGSLQVDFDLLGPEPPTDIEVGVGEESLVVKFDALDDEDDTDGDISKYYVYCDVAGEGVGGAGTDASGCGSSLLVPGEPPPDANRCGDTTRTSEEVQTDDDLENGTLYAVGIAAVDTYGNPGPLSAIACATPEPINGFFEQYRAAGGKGGGGFCSFSRTTTARGLWLGAAVLAGSLFVRRRVKGGSRG
jgi:hypothetical protein